MASGPFTVAWEGCDADDWGNPAAAWAQHTRQCVTEREAVGLWQAAKLYENTRPVSITPEPDWSRYSYDGRNPITKQ